MRQRRLGARGPEVGAVGLGCMGMTTAYDTNERDDEESVRVIHRAVELGVTLVDTAEVYGPYENEELVGHALAEGNLRDRVVLATKTGLVREHEGIRPDGRPERIREAIDGSLRRLGTDNVDLYYLHRVDPEVPIEESWGAMKEVVEAGKAVRLGVSEAKLEQIEQAHAIRSRLCSRRCRCGPASGSRQALCGMVRRERRRLRPLRSLGPRLPDRSALLTRELRRG